MVFWVRFNCFRLAARIAETRSFDELLFIWWVPFHGNRYWRFFYVSGAAESLPRLTGVLGACRRPPDPVSRNLETDAMQMPVFIQVLDSAIMTARFVRSLSAVVKG